MRGVGKEFGVRGKLGLRRDVYFEGIAEVGLVLDAGFSNNRTECKYRFLYP